MFARSSWGKPAGGARPVLFALAELPRWPFYSIHSYMEERLSKANNRRGFPIPPNPFLEMRANVAHCSASLLLPGSRSSHKCNLTSLSFNKRSEAILGLARKPRRNEASRPARDKSIKPDRYRPSTSQWAWGLYSKQARVKPRPPILFPLPFQ